MHLYIGYSGRQFGQFAPCENFLIYNYPDQFPSVNFFYCGNGRTEGSVCAENARKKAEAIIRLVAGRDATEEELRDVSWQRSVAVRANSEFADKIRGYERGGWPVFEWTKPENDGDVFIFLNLGSSPW